MARAARREDPPGLSFVVRVKWVKRFFFVTLSEGLQLPISCLSRCASQRATQRLEVSDTVETWARVVRIVRRCFRHRFGALWELLILSLLPPPSLLEGPPLLPSLLSFPSLIHLPSLYLFGYSPLLSAIISSSPILTTSLSTSFSFPSSSPIFTL